MNGDILANLAHREKKEDRHNALQRARAIQKSSSRAQLTWRWRREFTLASDPLYICQAERGVYVDKDMEINVYICLYIKYLE